MYSPNRSKTIDRSFTPASLWRRPPHRWSPTGLRGGHQATADRGRFVGSGGGGVGSGWRRVAASAPRTRVTGGPLPAVAWTTATSTGALHPPVATTKRSLSSRPTIEVGPPPAVSGTPGEPSRGARRARWAVQPLPTVRTTPGAPARSTMTSTGSVPVHRAGVTPPDGRL